LTSVHDYQRDQPSSSLAPETVLQDRYRIVRQLGRGGMGAVYEAVDQRLGITVALKETFSSEASMRKQFEREARLLAGMQHSALPRVSDHFVEGNRAFLVMEYIGGVDLARIIAQQPGPFPRDQVIAWADQLLDALIYLHTRDRQVIHRDIKPHNLKLTANGQIALLDFGLAKAQPADASITSSQAFFGYTRHYAPLEQIQDQRTDARSDIYALGATLYHLLTGIKPPDAMVRAAAVINAGPDPLVPADEIHPAVGPQIAAILSKALAQQPEDRYADAYEFRQALRRVGRITDALIDAAPKVVKEAELPTIHINELTAVKRVAVKPLAETPAMNIALVASARHFGPAGMTAVLALVVSLAAGIIYGSQRWFPVSETATSAPAGMTQSAIRKVEPRVMENTAGLKRRGTSEGNTLDRNVEKKASAEPVQVKTEKRPARAQAAVNHWEAANTATPKNVRRPGAPSIRLPNPEFRENAPAPSPDARVRTFGSSSSVPMTTSRVIAAVRSPRFYRAPDGTQIVKFSDGSTQFVRPGQRSSRSGSYR
jgi:predicted Ser/Thr protein kinase